VGLRKIRQMKFSRLFMNFYFFQNIKKELSNVSKLDRYGRQNLKKMKHFKLPKIFQGVEATI